jgi:Protein of unknown function (DUF2582).
MIMSVEEIDKNAGTVYHFLFHRGSLSLRKIGELTHKNESMIYLSLGWLLREDKIRIYLKDGEWYFDLK